MGIVVGFGFGVKSIGRDILPGFTKEGNESFPVSIWNASSFERTDEKTAFPEIVVMFPVFGLLSDDRGDESIELLDVFLDGVGGKLLVIEELTFQTKFIFARWEP